MVALDHAVTAAYSVPGLKYAMRQRGAPAGHVRSPHQPVGDAARDRLDSLLADLDDRFTGPDDLDSPDDPPAEPDDPPAEPDDLTRDS